MTAEKQLTVAEVGVLLRMDVDEVRRLIASGKLKARKLSARRTRVPESEVDAYLAAYPLGGGA